MGRLATFDIENRLEKDATREERKARAYQGEGGRIYGGGPQIEPGRMFKITPEKRRIILDCIRKGGNKKMAAGLAQISYETLHTAMRTGKAALTYADATDTPLTEVAQFYLDMQMAHAEYLQGLVGRFECAMVKEPKMAMALLELMGRLQPEDLGRRQVMKIEQDTTVKIEFVEKSGAEWQSGKVAETRQKSLPPGEADGVIDTEFREESDDHAF